MNDKVYKKLELTGTSEKSIEDAVQTAITRASHSVRNMSWFEIVETTGSIEDNRIKSWQVTFKVGFSVEEKHSL